MNQLERFLDVGAPAIMQTALNVVLVGAVFAVASWQLLVVAFLPIPLIVGGSLLFQRRLEPLYAEVRAAVADLVRGAGVQPRRHPHDQGLHRRGPRAGPRRAASTAYRQANVDAIRSSAAFMPLIRMAILAGFTATLLIGGWAALAATLNVGLYSALVFMTQRLLWPLTDSPRCSTSTSAGAPRPAGSSHCSTSP